MNIYKILVIACTLLLLSGCSAIKSRFFKSKPALTTSTSLNYNFTKPRRAVLTSELVNRYRLPEKADAPVTRFTYFSANGNRCQTLSLVTPKAACLVNNQWTEAAPILVGNIPQ